MSIEIKQLHVRSQIVQRAAAAENEADEAEKQAAQQKALLEECRRMLTAMLNKQKER